MLLFCVAAVVVFGEWFVNVVTIASLLRIWDCC